VVDWEKRGAAVASTRQAKPQIRMPFVAERIHEPPNGEKLLVRQLYHRIGGPVKIKA